MQSEYQRSKNLICFPPPPMSRAYFSPLPFNFFFHLGGCTVFNVFFSLDMVRRRKIWHSRRGKTRPSEGGIALPERNFFVLDVVRRGNFIFPKGESPLLDRIFLLLTWCFGGKGEFFLFVSRQEQKNSSPEGWLSPDVYHLYPSPNFPLSGTYALFPLWEIILCPWTFSPRGER